MMMPSKLTIKLVGILYLIVFVSGILIYQFLRGPFAFSDQYLIDMAENSTKVIGSVLLALVSGTITITISVLLYPLFSRASPLLSKAYIAFCIINFAAIMLENWGALSLLEISNSFNLAGPEQSSMESLGQMYYNDHRWAHYMYLFLSCFPVTILYVILFRNKLVPKWLSAFGIFAAFSMATYTTLVIFGIGASDNFMLPIALVQLLFPIWIIIKGFKVPEQQLGDL